MPETGGGLPVSPARAWTVAGLLFVAGFINYLDRAIVSVALPAIALDLHLGPASQGLLLSGFFWSSRTWRFRPTGSWLENRIIMPDKYVFDTAETVRYRFPTHTNDLVLDRADAETSEAFLVVLEPGEAPPLHVHHDTEQIFYVISGEGELQIGAGERDAPAAKFPVRPTNLARIPPHAWHRIFCRGDRPLVYLSVDCFLAGRPKDQPTWESHVRAMCANNGWDFDSVVRR